MGYVFFCWMKVQLIRVAKPGLWYLPPCLRALRHAHKWSNTAQEVTYHHISSLLVVSLTRMAKTKTVETCWNHMKPEAGVDCKPNGWLCHTIQVSILHQPVMVIRFAHRAQRQPVQNGKLHMNIQEPRRDLWVVKSRAQGNILASGPASIIYVVPVIVQWCQFGVGANGAHVRILYHRHHHHHHHHLPKEKQQQSTWPERELLALCH